MKPSAYFLYSGLDSFSSSMILKLPQPQKGQYKARIADHSLAHFSQEKIVVDWSNWFISES